MVTTGPQNNDFGTNDKRGSNELPGTSKHQVGGMQASDADAERWKVAEHKEQLSYDFKEMMSSAEALLRSTAQYTGAEVEEARERLQQQLGAARERSGAMTESMREMKQRFASQADECVHNHPWTCIGAAFVLGMGVAHCMRR